MEIETIIENFRRLKTSSYPYNEAEELFNNINIEPSDFVTVILPIGSSLMRARVGNNFTKASELSYAPKTERCQRASLPNETMFYGAIISKDQKNIDKRTITISECSSLLRQGKESSGIEHITYGRWGVSKDIKLAAMPDDNVYNNVQNNPLLSELHVSYERRLINNDNKDAKLILSFLAQEFANDNIQNDNDYFVSAFFAHKITRELGFDGITYPSVMIEGQIGLNIAIKPDIADNNLCLIQVGESTLYKNKDTSIDIINRTSNMTTWEYRNSPSIPDDEICKKLGIKSLNELV